MNQNETLKLHISTPSGVVYDDFVANVQVKIHDGYIGINKNRVPLIEPVQLSRIKIKKLDSNVIDEYIISSGLMITEKYSCKIYVDYLISNEDIETNSTNYLEYCHDLRKKYGDQFEKKQEELSLNLRKELKNLKN